MIKVIAKNYYSKDDYRFLEDVLRIGFYKEIGVCEDWDKKCRKCTNQKACKDIEQLISYLRTINK